MNPGDADLPEHKLKTWLNTSDAGILQSNTGKSDCTPATTSVQSTQAPNTDLNICPNPSQSGVFKLQLLGSPTEVYQLQVIDITGKIVLKGTINNQSSNRLLEMDLSHLSDGIYIMNLSNEYGTSSKKIVISKND